MNKSVKRVSAVILSGIMTLSSMAATPCYALNVNNTNSLTTGSDNQEPSAVTGLSYKSTANSVTLNWRASPEASGYYIYIKSANEPYNYIKFGTVEGGNITTWTKGGLSSGKVFELRVKPYKTVGTRNIFGDNTDIKTSTLPGSVRKVVFSDNTSTSVKIKWLPVTGADGYHIYRRLLTDKQYRLVKNITDQALSEWSDSTLAAGKDYEYSIRAYKKVDNKLCCGEYLKASTSTAPAPLKGLKVASATYNKIQLKWTVSAGASGYYILIRSDKEPYNYIKFDTVEGGNIITWTREGLSSGKVFDFRVQPYRTVGEKIYRGEYGEISTGTAPSVIKTIYFSDISSNSITVNWRAINGADGYNIARKLPGDKNYKVVKTITDPTQIQWTDNTLPAGTDCSYGIRAFKMINGKNVYGAYNSKSSYTVPETISGLTVKAQKATSVTISWNKSAGASGYEVFRLSNGKYYKVGIITDPNTTEFTNEKLRTGTDYTYKVMAYKTVGEYKKYGNEAYVEALTLTSAVKALKVEDRTTNTIKLSWHSTNGADGYIVYRKDENTSSFSECTRIASDDSSIVAWTDSNLSSASGYSYRIVAYNMINGALKKSAFSEISACTLPETVTNFNVKAKSTSELTLSWNKIQGASGYIIYRQGIADPSKFSVIKTVENGNETTYTDSNLSSSFVYSYRVEAYKTVGERKYSGEYSSITGCTYPATTLKMIQDAQTTTAIKLKWTKVVRADGYIIYSVSGNTYKTIGVVQSEGDTIEFWCRNLTAGNKYSFAVAAYKDYKASSKINRIIGQKNVLTTATSPAITKSFTASNKMPDSLDLHWSEVSGASGYFIYKKNNDTGEYYLKKTVVGGNITSCHDDSLIHGSVECYRISAYTEINGKKIKGGYKELVTNTIPLSPNNPKVDYKTDKAIKVIWEEVNTVAGYRIERKASNESTFKIVGTVKGKANNTFVDRGLKSGMTYVYRISAYKTVNNSTVYSKSTMMTAKTYSSKDIENIKSEIVRLVNVERRKVGLNELTVRRDAENGSATRAKEISKKFEHQRPNGSSFSTAFGNVSYRIIGENIACDSYMTASKVMGLWMDSPGHRANILNGSFKTISIGIYMDIDCECAVYAVQNFFG